MLMAGKSRVEDGNDLPAIEKAIEEAKADTDRPTLIEVKTVIGYGDPNKQGKGGHGGTHGSPLGADEAKLTKDFYNWVYEEDFYVPEEVREHFGKVKERGIATYQAWVDQFAKYKEAYPELAAQFERGESGELAEGWDKDLPKYSADDKAVSTRVASGKALNGLTAGVPHARRIS